MTSQAGPFGRRVSDTRATPAARMRRPILFIALLAAVAVVIPLAAAPAAAQTDVGGCNVSELQGATQEVLSKEYQGKTERVIVVTGANATPVRIDCDDQQFYAEFVEIFQDRNLVVATRNVLVVSPTSRISADRMEFDTKNKTGVFYNANGQAALGDRVDKSFFGTQEPDALFHGKEIHKIGPKKYKVVSGAFSTCVQPTPRWELVSGEATLNLDDYALLKNTVLRVKGVPLFYLPIFYYPIQEDDRATGFLIPMYGTSTLRGQSLSNAFFWAINRSQDATFMHDWFAKAGQQAGAEYRYVLAPGSSGNLRASMFDQKATAPAAGTPGADASRSYRVDGGLSQNLGGGLRGRASANYFSNGDTERLYQQDVARATQSTRSFGGNISGNWREYSLSGTIDHIDYFNSRGSTADITTSGSLPRINFSRSERPIGGAPLYFGVSSDYVTIIRNRKVNDVTAEDQGLTRMEVNPTLRIPFTKVPFFTVNSTVGWRGTYWSESLLNGRQVDEALKRQYFDFNARVTGPVFMRIFSGRERKMKHVIEPVFNIRRVTPFDVFDDIVKLESSDFEVPNTTRIGYGLTNRIYSKRDVAREVVNVSIGQNYYSDPRASQYDAAYQNSFNRRAASKFGSVALAARVSPSDRYQTDFRTEWDHQSGAFLSFSANGIVNSSHVQASGGWTEQKFVNPTTLAATTSVHYLNGSVTLSGYRNRIGGTYAFNYDVLQNQFLQQRYFAYYNAQCCGVLMEYQTFNFTGLTIPQDRRFNISFTLAGIGTFSNFLGAFGGQTGR